MAATSVVEEVGTGEPEGTGSV